MATYLKAMLLAIALFCSSAAFSAAEDQQTLRLVYTGNLNGHITDEDS